MGNTLTPHQWIGVMEYHGGAFHAIVKYGLTENGLDQTLAPDLYTAIQNFREGVIPLYQALESLVVKYSLDYTPEEYWDGCE